MCLKVSTSNFEEGIISSKQYPTTKITLLLHHKMLTYQLNIIEIGMRLYIFSFDRPGLRNFYNFLIDPKSPKRVPITGLNVHTN